MMSQAEIGNFTDKVAEIISQTNNLAVTYGNPTIEHLHLSQALLQDSSKFFASVLTKANIFADALERKVNALVAKLPQQKPSPDPTPSKAFTQILQNAVALRKSQQDSFLSVDHLILALIENSDFVQKISTGPEPCDFNKQALAKAIASTRGDRKITSKTADQQFDALSKYAIDVTAQAQAGKIDPVIGRDDEIRRVIRVLCRRTKNNPCLVGEPGVGKTAIVEGLAHRIIRGDVPVSLNVKIYSLDLGLLIAGAKYQGEFEERLKAVLKEVQDSEGGIVLFVDEIHTLLGAGKSSGAMDAANLLKPMLARGQIRMIGATTLDEYQKYIEKDAAFERRLQAVRVGEPTVEDTISILRGIREKWEAFHGVRIADSALVAAATLSNRYITNRFLPDKAIDLVDEACAHARVQLDSQPEAIDILDRKIMQLEIEAVALSKEKGEQSQQRLDKVNQEISKLREEVKPLKAKYDAERQHIEELRTLNQKLESLKQKILDAERRYDLAQAADLKYYAVPEVEKRIAHISELMQAETERKMEIGSQEGSLVSDHVFPEQIMDVVAKWTGIPVARLSKSQAERILNLETVLHQRVVGQENAVRAVSDAIVRSRAGLSTSGTIGSFLFLGPTGVGKTELAKALTRELFDDDKKGLIRIDMSEYMEQHSVARLIGAPPGYVGFESGGQLTEAVRRNPYCCVLFDECEKAAPEVLNILLQLLDEGRLTDGQGRVVDFSNAIIILTSNIGAEFITAPVNEEIRQKVMARVRQTLKPELINRMDEICIFDPLGKDNLVDILKLQLKQVAVKLKPHSITLDITPKACTYVLDCAFDFAYGARPLRRYLERSLVTDISRLLVSGVLSEGMRVNVALAAEMDKSRPHHGPGGVFPLKTDSNLVLVVGEQNADVEMA